MSPAYIKKLWLQIRPTNIKAQNIDKLHLDIFGMIIVGFLLQDKLRKIWFFQKIFLVINTRIEVVLGMLFLTFSGANLRFVKKELVWKIYSATKMLLMTLRVQIIGKKEFTTVALNKKNKIFVVYMVAINVRAVLNVYLF